MTYQAPNSERVLHMYGMEMLPRLRNVAHPHSYIERRARQPFDGWVVEEIAKGVPYVT